MSLKDSFVLLVSVKPLLPALKHMRRNLFWKSLSCHDQKFDEFEECSIFQSL